MMRVLFLCVTAAALLSAEQNGITLVGSAQPHCWNTDAIVAEVTRGAASDREKALALHAFGMAHFIHFDGPIEERGEYVTDPVKLVGVYGYGLCMNISSAMCALYNAAGLKCRVRTMPLHSVPEVWFGGKWNYIDTDMFGYVFLPDGKTIASVDELAKDADLFLKQKNPPEPFYPFDEKKDMADVFRNVRTVKDHHTYADAHIMNLSLRTGARVTLYYRPKNRYLLKHLKEDLGVVYKDYWVVGPVRRGTLAWTDRPPATYGNGLFEYEPDLRSEAFRAENADNWNMIVRREGDYPPLAAAEKDRVAALEVEVSTPWVIAGLQNDLTDFEDDSDAAVVSGLFWRLDRADENRILVSTDNGRNWTKVWENPRLGAVPFRLDLSRHLIGRFAHKVRFEWVDHKGTGKVGLEDLKLRTWVALSPMALPRIAPGKNRFELATRPRRTFYSESRWQRGEGLPEERRENLAMADKAPYLRPQAQEAPGVLTFSLGPSGSVEEVRVSVLVRALGDKVQDVRVVLSLSEDNGENWQELKRFAPDPEHEENHMWVNHAIRGRTLNGERARVKVEVWNGGLEKVIANSAVLSDPKSPSALRVTHLWREGDSQRSLSRLYVPGTEKLVYEVEAAASGLQNEALKIESVSP